MYFCVAGRGRWREGVAVLVTLRAAVDDPFSFARHLSLLDTEEEELR